MILHHSQLTKIMESVRITKEKETIEAKEDMDPNVEEIGEVVMVAVHTVI